MGEISDSQMPLSQDVREIKNVTENWEAAVRAGNVAPLSTLVTDDAVFLAPGAPPVKGRDAIESLYRNVFAKFHVEQNSSYEEIQVIGEWAFGWGPTVLLSVRLPAGIRSSGRVMLLRFFDDKRMVPGNSRAASIV
jgi:ketosteroid isomerase-like protein